MDKGQVIDKARNYDKNRNFIHLHVGRSRSVCVDCSLSENYPGWVRTITIESETELQVEFDVYGYDEGGLYVAIEYSDIDTLIN